jgi:citrate lyase subunit beta / citryl-CoA lyase
MRSLLFVPADNERKLLKAGEAGADALALDLEDSVLPDRKAAARELLAEYLRSFKGRSEVWVRVNDLAGGALLQDLAAVVRFAPVGILLPKIRGPEDIDTVSNYLDMAEAAYGVRAGSVAILAVATETPSAVLRMSELLGRHRPRLKGLTWGGEDLSAVLGADNPRAADGSWRPVYEHARTQCLLACHALELQAIDTVCVDFKQPDVCRRSAEAARRDGFTGKIAIHPDQVPIINAAFTPTADEVAAAQRVIAAFATGSGAVSLGGKMLDMPHLKAAQRLLTRAPNTQTSDR